MRLRYGTNPQQPFAEAVSLDAARAPVELRNGTPSMVNMLDALNAWQLVREARAVLGLPAAASFKHVSPAGAAVAVPLDPELARAYEVEGRELTPVALAYVRARGADPKCSFGDIAALSDPVDEATAAYLKGVVSDGIIAPGYDSDALKILSAKKGGAFLVLEADPGFVAPERETRELFGMSLVQDRNAMLTTQTMKDAAMAAALVRGGQAAGRDGAVLIAGNGHVRADLGVPWHLRRMAPGKAVAAIGLLEVEEGENDPSAYGAGFDGGTLPFTFIWFSPRVDNLDPCEKYAEQLRRAGKKRHKP